jgi:predicted nucleic acid-binding protein
MVMKLTIDASVAIKFIVDEPGSTEARSYLPKVVGGLINVEHLLLAPIHMLLEVHHTLAKKFRKSLIELTALENAHSILIRRFHFAPLDIELIGSARSISLRANEIARPIGPSRVPFNIYDCLYIAHAQKLGSALLTADAELARIARDGFSVPVILIDVEALKHPN